jgi:hypothetical protein
MTSDAAAHPQPRARIVIGVAVWLVTTVPFLWRLVGWSTSGETVYYLQWANRVLDGEAIYSSVPFEYPPYALAWFLGPAIAAADLSSFRVLFGLLIWGLDAAVKGALIWHGVLTRGRPIDLLPVLLYTLATLALSHIFLQRFDVIPAALSFAGLLAILRWPGVAGAALAVAVGTKAYPVLCVPVMAAFAWRRGRSQAARFLGGMAVGLAPLAALSLWMPWWTFLSFHTSRGLQAESLWASLVWLGHFAGVPAHWGMVRRWMEVTGPVAAWLATPARIVWAGATLGSVVLAAWAAWSGPWAGKSAQSDLAWRSSLAVLVLLPLTTFVAFNPVFSPQFHLWLAPWWAAVLLSRDCRDLVAGDPRARRAVWLHFFATCLVPAFYPNRAYDTGLDLGRTLVLVLRNLVLVWAAWELARAVWTWGHAKRA